MSSKEPTIRLYNTLSKRKEVLRTGKPGRATIYVCGPTVYNYAHIGNARPAVVFDVLVRLLRANYPEVTYARNLTDVDDKINAAALTAGVPIGVITDRFITAYQQDMLSLGVAPPDIEPRVTEHIPDIIELIEKLVKRNHAYVAEAHVLFSVGSYAQYGALSGRRIEEMIAGARVEVAPYKRDPLDFVLWKPSDNSQPGWDSPWGFGRPGWHVECSAMIGRHLGSTIDIHGGGQDLIFPHHENEIAQGTCAHDGALYCRTWVHNSFVTVDGQKMSKSLGNVLLVNDLLKITSGEAIRFALISTHYRRPLDWNERRLEAAQQTLRRFYRLLQKVSAIKAHADAIPDDELVGALRNDLNTPLAIARLHQLIEQLEDASDADISMAKGVLLLSSKYLGLLQQDPFRALVALNPRQEGIPGTGVLSDEWVAAQVSDRNQARLEKDFDLADAIRRELVEAGIQIEDTNTETIWSRDEVNV